MCTWFRSALTFAITFSSLKWIRAICISISFRAASLALLLKTVIPFTLPDSCIESPFLCHRFALQLVEICQYICQYQYKALGIHKRPLVTHLTICYGRPSPLYCPSQPSSSGVLISPIAPNAVWHICVDHIQLWAVTVCKWPSQTKVLTWGLACSSLTKIQRRTIWTMTSPYVHVVKCRLYLNCHTVYIVWILFMHIGNRLFKKN